MVRIVSFFYVSLMLGYKVALFPYFSVAFAKDTQDKVNLKNVFNIGAILVLLGLFLYMINGGYSLKQLFIGGVSESVELTSSFLSGYGKQMIKFLHSRMLPNADSVFTRETFHI